MRLFIIPGSIPHLRMIARFPFSSVSGVLLHQRPAASTGELSGMGLAAIADRTFSFDSLRSVAAEPAAAEDRVAYTRILGRILGDPRTHYLATRSDLDSPFNNSLVVERIVLNSLRIVRRTRPDCLVSSSTPHSLEAWVFANCFEFLALPVYILEAAPVAFRAWLCRGLDTQAVVRRKESAGDVEISEATSKLVKLQRESRPGARDGAGHPVSRLNLESIKGSDTNRWWSASRELRGLRAGKLRSLPLRMHAALRKREMYASYRATAITELPRQPYVVFFMHYQPERSSLPVGRDFTQQWMAIRALSWALPSGWKLLVREHPTTWLKPLNPFVRTKSIYADIASLPDTHVCSMDIDTFELIDGSRAVATLTGNVGFQALVRGRPVLAFGVAPYKDHPACRAISTYDNVAEAMREIAAGAFKDVLSEDALNRYLAWVEQNSVCADHAESDWVKARLKNFAEIYRLLLHGELELA